MSDLESKFSFFIAVGISEVSVETVRYSYKQCKYVGMRLLLLVITVCVCARVHVCVCVCVRACVCVCMHVCVRDCVRARACLCLCRDSLCYKACSRSNIEEVDPICWLLVFRGRTVLEITGDGGGPGVY